MLRRAAVRTRLLGEEGVSGRARRVWGFLLSGLGLLVSCRENRGNSGQKDASPRIDYVPLRDDGRLILERHCGLCHIRDYPTARPGALAVFDLRDPDWSARMSDAQLRSASFRLGEPLPPDGSPNDVSDEERALFRRFVDEELARRGQSDGGIR